MTAHGPRRLLGRARAALVALAVGLAGLSLVPAEAQRIFCIDDGHPGGEWRMMGRDLGHGRHQPAERTIGRLEAARLQPAWTFSANQATGTFPNEITGYPIVADGCIFVGSSTGFRTPGWAFALEADGGTVVWKTRIPDGGIYSSAVVGDDLVYFFVSRVGSPYMLALDKQTGAFVWRTTVDTQEGSDAVSSPILFDGMIWVGVSGTAAEGDEETRFDFRGTSVLLDAARACDNRATTVPFGSVPMHLATECADPQPGATGGMILSHEYAIPDEDWDEGRGNAGGAIWSTISIDAPDKYGYVGTGNPFDYDDEHIQTNAVLKIDLDRSRPTFGQIVASYKGDIEEYMPEVGEVTEELGCDDDARDPVNVFLAGFECGRLDLDFGASPNIIRTRDGRRLIGAGQKSGVYHVMDPDVVDTEGQMRPVWRTRMGVPSLVGGIVGTPAFDGTAIYSPHTIGGYIASLDRDDGRIRWVSPTADGVHWGNPVTSANGVIYTPDLKGFLDAYDAGTGAPLLHRPLPVGANTGTNPTFSWGGVTVARNTVYVSVGVGLTSVGEWPPWPAMPDGFVIAFRPMRL